MYKIMLVDDEENILKSLGRTLRREHDLDIESYVSPRDAIKRARTCIFDVVISDCMMPDINGIDFLCELKDLQPDAIRILLTGAVNIDNLLSAVNKVGAFRFIAKPWDDHELISIIREGLRFRDIVVENRILTEKLREQSSEISFINSYLDRSGIARDTLDK